MAEAVKNIHNNYNFEVRTKSRTEGINKVIGTFPSSYRPEKTNINNVPKAIHSKKNTNKIWPKGNLKITCFKLDVNSVEKMDKLIQRDIYFSRAEILRIATRNFLLKLNNVEEPFSDINLNVNALVKNPCNKESVSSKFCPKMLTQIDQAVSRELFIESRSDFLRKSVKLFFEEHDQLHTSIEIEAPYKDELKVIAFKIMQTQILSINNLCKRGYYPSLSETVRTAIIDYIIEIIEYNNISEREYLLSFKEDDELTRMKLDKKKESACAKFPANMLLIVDNVIQNNSFSFTNRTNLIRLAINKFLAQENNKIW